MISDWFLAESLLCLRREKLVRLLAIGFKNWRDALIKSIAQLIISSPVPCSLPLSGCFTLH